MIDVSERDGPVWVITGMSGAGKATALRIVEQLGFTCIDNLPPALLDRVRPHGPARIAVVIDARGHDVGAMTRDAAAEGGVARRVVFLDAGDEVLARRLSESTRPHPRAAAGGTPSAIAAEREVLEPLRAAADVVIDTTHLTVDQLRERLIEVLGTGAPGTDGGLVCTVSSFGFKYGVQSEADWVVDARFLPNPFWEPSLRPLTGLDPPVDDYIFGQPPAAEFVERLVDLLGWTLEQAEAHGRVHLHVAIGCTGGRHRSVAVALRVAERLRDTGRTVVLRHRDVERPDPR